jgi:prepilin-type N-terminal cleavage/methylation domain-containing protein
MKKSSKKRGFSLGEILVAVAIMAVIAAVVIPSIGAQLNKGETGRVTSDLTSIRGAIEQFLADVRRYPSAMGQLSVKPLAATASDTGIVGGTFTTAQVGRWHGPYMTKEVAAAIHTGYGVSMVPEFRSFLVGTQKYITIAIAGLTSAEATEVDAAMDDGVLTTGNVRWTAGGSDTLRYLAVPVQQ